MTCGTKDLSLVAGTSFSLVLRWESAPILRKAITAISVATGAPRITVDGHGIPDGWRVAVTGVKGMTELNAEDPARLRDSDYHQATVIDANVIELNEVNGADFRPWTSGGVVQWNTPVSLAGFTGRLRVEDRHGGTLLASNLVADDPLDILELLIDDTLKTVTAVFPAAATTALAGKSGVWEVEMVSGDATPVVTQLLRGTVSVGKE